MLYLSDMCNLYVFSSQFSLTVPLDVFHPHIIIIIVVVVVVIIKLKTGNLHTRGAAESVFLPISIKCYELLSK